MVLLCLTCVDNNDDNEMHNEIPDWHKKDGNYSLLPKILMCDSRFEDTDSFEEKQEYDEKSPHQEINASTLVKKGFEKSSWMFYWSADPTNDYKTVNKAVDAYQMGNYGLLKFPIKDDTKITLNCPQIYKADGKVYPRHLHVVYLDSETKFWLEKDVKAFTIICTLDKKEIKSITPKPKRVRKSEDIKKLKRDTHHPILLDNNDGELIRGLQKKGCHNIFIDGETSDSDSDSGGDTSDSGGDTSDSGGETSDSGGESENKKKKKGGGDGCGSTPYPQEGGGQEINPFRGHGFSFKFD